MLRTLRIFSIIAALFHSGAAFACNDPYIVKSGDTLTSIARSEMGSIFASEMLYATNQEVIGDDPSLIYAGMALNLPCDAEQNAGINWSVMPSPTTLAQLTATTDIQILDIRERNDIAKGVIAGAISIPYGKWQGSGDNLGAPPTDSMISDMLGDAGVDLDKPIIIIHQKPTVMDVGRAARTYWILKSAGAKSLAILRDGFQNWEQAGLPIATTLTKRSPTFVNATLSSDWRATEIDMYGVISGQAEGVLLDARPHSLFDRVNNLGAAISTTIPTARNMPVQPLMSVLSGEVDMADGVQEVIDYLATHNIDETSGPVISFCDTGELAALNWFYASELAGLPNQRLYPESVRGWTNQGALLAVGGG